MPNFNLPSAYAMVMKAVEARGSDWIHRNDPNRPVDAHPLDCYNAFKVYQQPGATTFQPGCIIGHALIEAGLTTAEWLYVHADGAAFTEVLGRFDDEITFTDAGKPVSYTHLTLPTICSV